MKRFYVVAMALFIIGCAQEAFGMSGKNNPLIIFRNEIKYLLGHIIKAQFNPLYEFSVTSVIRKNAKGNFINQGDILSLSEKDIKEDIANNKWVYTPFYIVAKTRLSKGDFESIGALILGTDDEKEAQELHFAAVRSMLLKKPKN